MENFLRPFGPWIEISAKHEGKKTNLTIGIKLAENSLKKAFLYFQIEETILACFPINDYICCTSSESTIIFSFFLFNKHSINLQCNSLHDALILSSQISLCSRLSTVSTNPFEKEDKEFLSEYSTGTTEFQQSPDVVPTLPMVYDKNSQKTWKNRCKKINEPFYLFSFTFPMLFCTWNVDQKIPDANSFTFARDILRTGASFVAISLQEIDFSASAVILGGSTQRHVWGEVFDAASKKVGFNLIHEDSLGGVYVRFMLKKEFDSIVDITLLGHKQVRLGAAGVMCNKSALISMFLICGIKFAFIAVHLTAQKSKVEQRNMQMIHLLSILREEFVQVPDYITILGDLNYRVDLSYEEAIEFCNQNDIHPLLEKDQLNTFLKQTEYETLKTFVEPEIKFNPTFKFDQGTCVYDTSKKMRVPSYTDRILVKTGRKRIALGPSDTLSFETDILRLMGLPENVFNTKNCFQLQAPEYNYPTQPVCRNYTSYMDITLSDHKPVSALYDFALPIVDQKKYAEFKNIMKDKFNELYSLSVPSCSIEPKQFETTGKETLKLTNVSCALVKWKFEVVPENCTFSPLEGSLKPQESIDIAFEWLNIQKEIIVSTISIENGFPVTFEFWGKTSSEM